MLPIISKIKSKAVLFAFLAVSIPVSAIPSAYWNVINNVPHINFIYAFPVAKFPEFTSGVLVAIIAFKCGWRTKEWLDALLLIASAIYLALFAKAVKGYLPHNIIIVPTVSFYWPLS